MLSYSIHKAGLSNDFEKPSWFYVTNEGAKNSGVLNSWAKNNVEILDSGVRLEACAELSSQSHTLLCDCQYNLRGVL